jgi:anthranilate/para-aminobenzoate synthase component I
MSRVSGHCIVQLHSSDRAESAWNQPRRSSSVVLRCDSASMKSMLARGSKILRQWDDPLDALAWLSRNSFAELPAANAKWVGCLSYDLGRLFETLPATARDDLHLPLFAFALIDEHSSAEISPHSHPQSSRDIVSSIPRAKYLAAVARVIEYIRAGDIFQANLSQRFTASLPAQPYEIFDRLIEKTPATFGALLDFGDFALIGNSPELFFQVAPDRKIVTRPIKGTRPNSPGMEKELRDSVKDQAELNMIVDLERNDLGRVCEIGSVKVIKPREIESHPTVLHGVATIEGRLRDNVNFVDLLRGIFPGGSITGAPKIRAMQIIEELEPVRRGPYCGAVGTICSTGEMQFNMAIRTMIVKDGEVHIPVGGGIVADSNPLAEYEETLTKARAMFAALGIESI